MGKRKKCLCGDKNIRSNDNEKYDVKKESKERKVILKREKEKWRKVCDKMEKRKTERINMHC